MKYNIQKQVAAKNPVVNAALEMFSGSRIERVITRQTLDSALAADENGNPGLNDSDYIDEDNEL